LLRKGLIANEIGLFFSKGVVRPLRQHRLDLELEQVVDLNRDRLHGDKCGESSVIRRIHFTADFCGSRAIVRTRAHGSP
jgi:hypothetical protein